MQCNLSAAEDPRFPHKRHRFWHVFRLPQLNYYRSAARVGGIDRRVERRVEPH
jgi:hypothetical protein